MRLGRYRLIAQAGANRDAVVYRGVDPADEAAVEVRVLEGARADAGRWPALARRLRLAAMLEHPTARRVRELALEHDLPYVVLNALTTPSLYDALRAKVPLPEPDAVALGLGLAEVLSAAHGLGLAHGQLGPGSIFTTPGRELQIDFTGTAIQEQPTDLDVACRAPEPAAEGVLAGAADVYSLGALLTWLRSGHMPPGAAPDRLAATHVMDASPRESSAALDALIRAMLAAEPAERPRIQEVTRGLAALVPQPAVTHVLAEVTRAADGVDDAAALTQTEERAAELDRTRVPDEVADNGMPVPDGLLARGRLGRFVLLDKLGQGGMGAVYRARDPADGRLVAVKVLRTDWARKSGALRRFHKEARLLAEVNNPYVANLIEVNEDAGTHFLVMEYVAGTSLGQLLAERGKLDEPTALAIMADVARALVAAHAREIVHRDIKPENILLEGATRPNPPNAMGGLASRSLTPKLTDFGLARHVVESESLHLTQTGAILGTPLYMAPEQCAGGTIDPRTDVYALGATLFHLLAGRPPFQAPSPLAVIAMHCNEPPPPLQQLNPALSDGVCRLVEKALAKAPEARHADAAAFLYDLERLRRGEPDAVAAHPRLPAADPRQVVHYDWHWDLDATPALLWPHVSNTERLNRAVGLPAPRFTTVPPAGSADGPTAPRVRRRAEASHLGIPLAWEEHPFEWVEAQRMGVLREFEQGPFKWLVSRTELAPRAGGGTRLRHQVWVEPRGLLGRTVTAVEIGLKGRRNLERVYHRIDAALTGKLGDPARVDPFEESGRLPAARRQRLERQLDSLSTHGLAPVVVERLGEFLADAPAQEVARIRPLALARRLGLDPEQVVAACLHGAHDGLLLLLWDILCPLCRIPSDVKDTLKAVREHGRCDACQLDYELDFANSVELIFQAHPEIREAERRTYCVGGPAHSPHVVAQVRVAPGERCELPLALAEGAYRLRGPQLPYAVDFRVQAGAALGRWDVDLLSGRAREGPRVLRAGGQLLVLANDAPHELVVRVERAVSRDDALTAARAAALALFRALFPGEILSPGQLVRVATITLLVTSLEGAGELYQELGDARAFTLLHEHFQQLNERIRAAGGALVKTVGEGVVAVFADAAAAVRAGLELQTAAVGGEAAGRLRVGVHRGPALAATLNDHLDYFGATASQAVQLPLLGRGGEVLLTETVAADPSVAALLRERGLEGELFATDLPGLPGCLVHRLRGWGQAG